MKYLSTLKIDLKTTSILIEVLRVVSLKPDRLKKFVKVKTKWIFYTAFYFNSKINPFFLRNDTHTHTIIYHIFYI